MKSLFKGIFVLVAFLVLAPFVIAWNIIVFLFTMAWYILLLLGLIVCIMIGPLGWAIIGFCIYFGYDREKERRHREMIDALHRRNE